MRGTALLLVLLSAGPSIAGEQANGRCAPVSIDERACLERLARPIPAPCEATSSEIAEDVSTADHPIVRRLVEYARLAVKHRVSGLASYYSSFFDGRKTANGETFRNRKFSAAHLTLPLGTWIEVRSRATGRSLRLRVNDRGPYVRKFVLDLSQAAARHLGVDRTRDRHVEIRIVALPGEEPIPPEIDLSSIEPLVLRELQSTAR